MRQGTARIRAGAVVAAAATVGVLGLLFPGRALAGASFSKDCVPSSVGPGDPAPVCTIFYEWATPEDPILRVLDNARDVCDVNGQGLPALPDSVDESAAGFQVVQLGDKIVSFENPANPGFPSNVACTGCNTQTDDPSTCSLPCIVCGPFETESDGALECPGAQAAGRVTFEHDECAAPSACFTENWPVVSPSGVNILWDKTNIRGISNVLGNERDADPSFPTSCTTPKIDKDCPDNSTDAITINWEDVLADTASIYVVDEFFPGQTCEEVDPANLSGPGTGALLDEYQLQEGDFPDGTRLVQRAECSAGCNVAWLVSGVGAERTALTLPAFDDCLCGGENYKCYKVKNEPRSERFPRQTVQLSDQFRSANVDLLRPYQFCNPVDKFLDPLDPEATGDGIENFDGHLMCYKFVERARGLRILADFTDQFGTEEMFVGKGRTLCVPALKNCEDDNGDCSVSALEELINHFQCYDSRPVGGPLDPPLVGLVDQFESKLTEVDPSRSVCTPTSKNEGPVPDEERHLKCYGIEDAEDQEPFGGTSINVLDQFGEWNLRVGGPTQLCESATKRLLEPEVSPRSSRR